MLLLSINLWKRFELHLQPTLLISVFLKKGNLKLKAFELNGGGINFPMRTG